ncbi:MAG: ATP-dependent 6-phosphofructokinase [Byssovorax sp.]
MLTQADLDVLSLGERRFPSPLSLSTVRDDQIPDYVPDGARVTLTVETTTDAPVTPPLLFEKAGPRQAIYFEPSNTRAAIVTCGGLCPGINNVIRSMVLELHHRYQVKEVLGFRYGFEGLCPEEGLAPLVLGPKEVRSIHTMGGSFLGLSRGKQDPVRMVDTLEQRGIDVLFTIGGDGTLRGAHAIHEEIARRGGRIAVIGVPKTIDNDIAFVDKTFGYDSAVEVARDAVDAGHTEAIGARNGISVVKLMGRDSGFIAAAATLASLDVNFCLVPEVRFDLEGDVGLFAALRQRLAERAHAVIVVAEGCGASLLREEAERDASGNIRYASAAADIGPVLRDAIAAHFAEHWPRVSVKYIDPSYMIRSVAANASDSIFCDSLARHAVHAGMAGKTDLVIGRWHRLFTHVPLNVATSQKKCIDPDGDLWLAVTETTGQPPLARVDPSHERRNR